MIKDIGVGFDEGAVDRFQIESCATSFGITFPTDYVNLLSAHDYLYSIQDSFNYIDPKGNENSNSFRFSGFKDEVYGDKVKFINNKFVDYYLEIVRFARTPNGDSIGFDYRENKYEPSIVLLLHDWTYDKGIDKDKEYIIKLADKFSDFINSLFS